MINFRLDDGHRHHTQIPFLDVGTLPFAHDTILPRVHASKSAPTAARRGACCGTLNLLVALVIGLSCLGSAGLVASSIYSIGEAVRSAEEEVSPVLTAFLPSLKHAGDVLGSASRASSNVERLVNHSITATDAAVPAMERAVAMIDNTALLMDRMARLAKSPTLRVQMGDDP